MTQYIGYCSFNIKRFSYHCHSYILNSKISKHLQISTLSKCCLPMSTFKKNATLHSKYYCGTRKHSTFIIAIMLTMTALYLVSLIGPLISRPLLGTSVKIQNEIPVYSILGYKTFHKNIIQGPFKSNNHISITQNGNDKLKSHKKVPLSVVDNIPWWISSDLLDKLMGKTKLKKDVSYSVPANKLSSAQKNVNGLGRSLASFPWLNETASDIFEQCRNSIQGPQFVTDERGYFCHRTHLLPNGCCDINQPRPDNFMSPDPSYNDDVGETYVPEYVGEDTKSDLAITPPNVYDDITPHAIENGSHHLNLSTRSNLDTIGALSNASLLTSNNESFGALGRPRSIAKAKLDPVHKDSTVGVLSGVGGRYVCATCGHDSCCAMYEHCVSCCLDPDRRAAIHAVMARWGRGRDRALTAARDHFEACLARCRTWSGSVQHENAYRSPRAKYCFGTAMAPIDTVESVVPNHVGSVNK